MPNVSKRKFHKLVYDYGTGICEAKECVVGEYGLEAHGTSVEKRFMSQSTACLQIRFNSHEMVNRLHTLPYPRDRTRDRNLRAQPISIRKAQSRK